MDRYADFVIKHRKLIVILFITAAVLSAVMLLGVHVNYKLADYLPPTAQSTEAVRIMDEEFAQAVPNADVMVRDVSIPEALACKSQLEGVVGIEEVLWLDDTADLKKPLEMYDADMVEEFYKDGDALYSVSITEGMESEAVHAIRELFGKAGAVSGEAADTSAMRSTANTEVAKAVLILVPSILLILILSTSSFIEPLLFLAAIGVSIVINMGTNIFQGEISFVTNAVAPVLQLAVSLDYAIFLLHSFADYQKEEPDIEQAMKQAMKKSVKAVAASAVTTLFGFLALAFMKFGIGADLGLNLTKGIMLSFICCMVFLPALTLLCGGIIKRTQHRALLPSFQNVNRVLSRLAVPALVIVAVLTIPAFLGQRSVEFSYGNEEKNTKSRNFKENQAIRDRFGQITRIALLVPRGDIVREYELGQRLAKLNHVTGVVSYASQVGTGIPEQFLDADITGQFYSENYARIVLYTDTANEGEEAFAVVEAVNREAAKYYQEDAYSAGPSANLYDMKEVVKKDNLQVNLIAIISIFLVLLLTFRSAILPFVLLFTIESGIWINLSIPYFTATPLHFMGYLVISTVQLGATVDYAILLTSYYLDNRRRMGQKEAMHKSMGETCKSILMSGTTLTIAGVVLRLTSSNPIVSELGALLARGTVFSMLMVFCLLPGLLRILDKPIGAVTYKSRFY